MKRPSFQFYPADWRNNANLRRCSWAARGVWIEIMGLLHDSDHYGVLRWTLKEIAQALGCPVAIVKELACKDVLKGCDSGDCDTLIYVPRSGRKDGQPVTLIDAQPGPIWYSSRMVKDEYIREVRGENSRFDGNQNQSPKQSPKPPIGESPKQSPKPVKGDGSTSTSTSSGKPLQRKTTSTTDTSPPVQPPDSSSSSESAEAGKSKRPLTWVVFEWEKARGKTARSFVGGSEQVEAWEAAGVTKAQLRQAYDLAVAQREADKDPAPINVKFLDLFVAKVLNPREAGSAVTVKAWYESAPGIEAKGRELGIDPPDPLRGGFPAFKARVFAAAGLTAEA